MKITFEVKKVDIKRGEVYCRSCPIALALRRLVKPKIDIRVFTSKILLMKILDGTRPPHSIRNTSKLKAFISRYDQGKNVEPTRFQIDIPEEYLAAKYTKNK